MRRGWRLGLALALLWGSAAAAQQPRYAGRPLADVLSELSRAGLTLVYSSRVVGPELTVPEEPRATTPRRILDEVLAQHGLCVKDGPRGRLLVVRLERLQPPPAEATPDSATAGTLRVRLRARASDRSIAASSVELRSEDGAATALADGRVLVRDLAGGPRFLEGLVPGFSAPPRAVVVRAGQTVDVVLDLDPSPGAAPPFSTVPVTLVLTRGVDYQEIVVVSERPLASDADASAVVLTPGDLLQGAGHTGNLFSAMQALPGVKSGREFDSRLVVRGGSPDENLIIVDGVEIHAPYHLFGLASTILPSAVESVAWSAGGFDARYGDRLSSVLAVRTRDGTAASRTGGSVGAGLLDSDFVVEGPVPGARGASWLAAGRYSFYDVTAGALLGFGFPAFADVHAKLTWAGRPEHRVWLQGTFGRERTDYVEHDDPGERWSMQTNNQTILASAGLEAAMGGRARVRGVASLYRLTDAMGIEGAMATDARAAPGERVPDGRLARVDFSRATGVEDLAVRQELSVVLSPRQSIDAGVEAHWFRTRWSWLIDGDRSHGLANSSLPWPYGLPGASLPSTLDSGRDYTRAGGFVQYGLAAGRVTSQVGARVDRSSLTGEATVSPRGSVALRAGDATRVRASAGVYRQSPGYEKLLVADRFVDLSDTAGLASERAIHAAVAIERDLSPGVTARVEAYRKTYDRIVVGRLETGDEQSARLARYDFGPLAADVPRDRQITAIPVNGGRGFSRGVDVLVAKNAPAGDSRVSGWIAYSYAKARQEVYGLARPADYDRRHAVGAVAQYRFSPAVALSGTLRVASGAPWTPPVGLRVAATRDRADADRDGDREEWVPARDATGALVYTHDFGGWPNVNSARLPAYARLDARLTFTPGGASGRWLFYVDAVNLLNRNNAGLIACRVSGTTGGAVPTIERTPDLSIPLLPSFGFRYRF